MLVSVDALEHIVVLILISLKLQALHSKQLINVVVASK
jgi:hypothetical protein